eukprot:TRINITY_DN7781_c0_g1_i3.p1 TRINITY_DN7781_c0_g1~~TRINITY_DN7781_c0_g1_i3.p1  ORF type:complete len:267 (-),score=97.94 TRINITY_DN7781_c0_g1_i3:163-963(-)
METGDFAAAAKHYTDAIQLQPTAMTIAKRAVCLVKLGCAEAALRDADRALELNADSPAANKARARALLKMGKFEDAMHACQLANRLDYDDSIYEIQKKLEGAFAAVIQAQTERDQCEKAFAHAEKVAKQAELRAKREAEQAAEAQEQHGHGHAHGGHGGKGGGKGGMPDMGGMGGIPPELMGLMADPEVAALLGQPKVSAAFTDIMSNGMGAMGKYANDPEVMQAMMLIQEKMQSAKGGGKGGMPGGKGGKGGMGGMPGMPGGMPF